MYVYMLNWVLKKRAYQQYSALLISYKPINNIHISGFAYHINRYKLIKIY